MRDSSGSVFDYLTKDVSASGSFHSRKSGVIAADGEVLHAVDADGRPTLLIPIGGIEHGPLAWQSRSLKLQALDLGVDGSLLPFIVLRCVAPNLQHQFGLLADDVLDAIEMEPEKAAGAVIAVLNRWRNLFEADRGAVLGPSQLAGLLAELSFLQDLVNVHGPQAFLAWRGPKGGRHDFVFSGCSVEVKATMNHNNLVVTIHGGRQLSAPDGGDLYLRAFQLEPSPTGVSVPSKIDELVALGVSRIDLLSALREVNYSDSDAPVYESTKFVLLQTKSFLVNEMFPRITPETVVPADTIARLSNISYSVDLGQLESIDHNVHDIELAIPGRT